MISDETAFFSLSEAKIGLVPATISPFVVHKTGVSRFNALSLQAHRFSAQQALTYGLVHYMSSEEESQKVCDQVCQDILNNAPQALKKIKQLSKQYLSFIPQDFQQSCSDLIAQCRVSSEGQEGLQAFLDKRKPNWNM